MFLEFLVFRFFDVWRGGEFWNGILIRRLRSRFLEKFRNSCSHPIIFGEVMRFQRGASGIRCSRKVCSVKYLSGQKLYYTERIWCLHACCSYIARHSRRLRPRNNARGSGTAAAASLTTISKDLLIQRRAHERARGAEFRWGRGGRRGGSDRIGSSVFLAQNRNVDRSSRV